MFVQIIEGQVNDAEAVKALGERWQEELRPGAVGYLGVTAGATADGRSIAIVRFEDEASARKNSERPEQGAWFGQMAKLYDGEPAFAESSEVDVFLGGGSNDAGFVQVMKATGADRSKIAQLDDLFLKYADMRPDLLGTFRIWTGDASYVEVAYFTSEAEARKGESVALPEELEAAMGDLGSGMGAIEYLDLSDPQLH